MTVMFRLDDMRRFVSEGIILKSVGYKNILGKMQGPGTTTGLVDKQRKSRENAEKPRQHRPLCRNCAGHSRIEAIYDDLTPFHPFPSTSQRSFLLGKTGATELIRLIKVNSLSQRTRLPSYLMVSNRSIKVTLGFISCIN